MQGLEGVKVLEIGHMVSAAYATKLMADLGADVIKVEERDGDLALPVVLFLAERLTASRMVFFYI